MNELVCKSCKRTLPEENYYFVSKGSTKRRPSCKECASAKAKVRNNSPKGRVAFEEGRETRRIALIWARYKISEEDYLVMIESQNGRCKICCRVTLEWHIDHDHKCCPQKGSSCGKCIRGLLCSKCNRALGLLYDNEEVLGRTVLFLNKGVWRFD